MNEADERSPRELHENAAQDVAEMLNAHGDETVPAEVAFPLSPMIRLQTEQAILLKHQILVYRAGTRWRVVDLVPEEVGADCVWCGGPGPTTRNRCTACLYVLEQLEAATGEDRPYGYSTVPSLGGACVVCGHDDGSHNPACGAVT